MAVHSSSSRFTGMIDARNPITGAGYSRSAWKYDRVKPKTALVSSGLVSTASSATPCASCVSASTSGTSPRAERSRPTTYAPLLR